MKWAYVAATGVAALMMLSGCEVDRGGAPLEGQPSSDFPQACPRIYNPVCGSRHGDRRTFPNACEAQSAGYSVRYGGQCQASGGPGGGYGGGPGSYGGGEGGYGGPGGGYGQPGGNDAQGGGQVCPMIYKPVCGRRGGDTRTFPNDCQAESKGYDVIYQSECLSKDTSQGGPGSAGGSVPNGQSGAGQRDAGQAGGNMSPSGGSSDSAQTTPSSGGGQSCSRTFVPVCGKKGDDKKTFINACMAKSKGYSVAAEGRCE